MACSHKHTLFLAAKNSQLVADFLFMPETRQFIVAPDEFNQSCRRFGDGSQNGVTLSKHVCSEVPVNG